MTEPHNHVSAGSVDAAPDHSELRKLQEIIDNQADCILDLHEVLKAAYSLHEFIAGAYILSLADFRYLNVVSTKIKAALCGDVAQSVGMREALEDTANWLEGCLTCKTWSWDGLQRDAAEKALEGARAILASQPSPAAPVETAVSSDGEPSNGKQPLMASRPAPPVPSDPQCSAETEDVRWAVNYLLEQIAAKFEAWDTFDLFRSEAASTVRSFKHDLSSVSPQTARLSGANSPSVDLVDRWPLGCHSPNSCSRNGRCMYVGCKHDGKDIKTLASALSRPPLLRDEGDKA